jgi:hypothetical protein
VAVHNDGGERDGHEAETFPLQVLHGGGEVSVKASCKKTLFMRS